MIINEMYEQLKNDGLLKVHVGSSVKQFVFGDSVYNNEWSNLVDVFGIYAGQDGRYCFFITDSERGIPEYSSVHATENEACEALLKKISRAEKLYQKSKK